MKCPKCDSSIEESTVICRYCRSRIAEPPLAATAPAGASGGKSTFKVIDMPVQPTGRPWEVWVVIGILALNIAGGLIQGRIGGLLVGALVISGLFKQSNGAWWFVTVVNVLAAIVCFVFASERGPELLINGACCLIVVGLMISCRVRGAYGASMD
jgi:hypothetical protein